MPSDYPFHELDNVIMTPHVSGWTEGMLRARSKLIAANIDRAARGEPPLNLIEGYRAALRRDRVGLGFSVFVGVKVEGHANERALRFEEAVSAMPEVIACHLVSGEADYFLEVVVPDLEHYQRFLVGKLLNLPIVREVRSNIAIQTLKAGAPLPLGHLDTRP